MLKAEEDGGQYSFEATGIENTDQPFPQQMFGHALFETIKRKEMLQLQWTFYNNSATQMNTMFGISMTDNPLPQGFDLIETDYKEKMKKYLSGFEEIKKSYCIFYKEK